MKILVLADIDDLHFHGEGGQADVLLACGDVYDQVILEAAEAYGCGFVGAVRGNHDPASEFTPPITDLHLRVVEFGGLRFGGLNGSWRYKPRGHFLYSQEEVRGYLDDFPAVDVFVSHNSPRLVHDRDDDVHYGFEGLRSYIERAKPRAVIHGHQHVNEETMIGDARVIGVFGNQLVEV